jgi:hypothetical protein
MDTTTNAKMEGYERVIGMDAHPDSFTAAVLRGPTPAAAYVERMFDKVPMGQLPRWARKHLTERDQVVLEASGNSFHVVRTLRGLGFRALVLESCHLGKLKEAHANNDKISAVRIGKGYLAGTAKTVWVPDVVTQERRDWFHAHRKTTKRTTQMRNRLSSYLSDNGVRLEGGLAEDPAEQVRQAQPWSPRQAQVLDGMLLELRHAEEQRDYWRSLIAQEVLLDPLLCSLVRICGIAENPLGGAARKVWRRFPASPNIGLAGGRRCVRHESKDHHYSQESGGGSPGQDGAKRPDPHGLHRHWRGARGQVPRDRSRRCRPRFRPPTTGGSLSPVPEQPGD